MNCNYSVILILIFFSTRLVAQDTTGIQTREGYNQWSKRRTCLRASIGIQESFYAELGVSRLSYYYNDLGYASSAYYAAVELIPTFWPEKPRNIFGIKAGYEINARVLALGLEGKYQSDSKENLFILTPRIGFGVFGIVNIFYGYNIIFGNSSFDKVGHNQFSLVVNLNRHI